MVRACGSRMFRWLANGLFGLVFAVGAMGCGGENPAPPNASTDGDKEPDKTTQKPGNSDTGNNTNTTITVPTSVAVDPKYQLPFNNAITEEIIDGCHLPKDKTISDKPTAHLRLAVEKKWSQVSLTDASGKPTSPVVVIETDLGNVEITLNPDLAPNHVRNFIALVQTKYYEGLFFDGIVRQELKDDKGNVTRFNLVRGGCPYGTGEQGCGHLGYFLKSEFNKAIKHEEGTVGFWREMLDDESVSELSNLLRRDTAGCRFYITLGPAAVMDGHYSVIGKVTKGIDIVKQINAMPTISESEVPQKLIRMKSVSMK